jgi:two-component system cell cycle sensor histidine kinase/response regulator CckA
VPRADATPALLSRVLRWAASPPASPAPPGACETAAPAQATSSPPSAEGDGDVGLRWVSGLLATLPGMAYRARHGPGWPIEFASAGTRALTGYDPEEFISGGKPFAELIHPEDAPGVWREVQEAVEEMRAYEVAYRIRRRDGATAWVWERGQPVEDGHVLLGWITDVSRQNRLEAALRESERYFRALVEHAFSSFAVVTAEGTVRFAGGAMRWLAEGDPADRIGHDVFETVVPDDRPRARAAFQRILEAPDEIGTALVRVRDRTGGMRTMEIRARNRLSDPVVEGVIVNARDVTETVEALRRLEVSEQRYRSLFQYNPDAVVSFSRTGRFTSVNAAVAGITGYTPAELLGRSYEPLMAPDRLAEAEARFRRALEGEPQNYESALLHKNGARVELNVTKFPIVVKGRVRGVFAVVKDVTEMRRAARELGLRDRAIAAVSDGLVITDPGLPDNPIVYVNPAFTRLTGFPAAEAVGRNCRFLQGPETDPAAVASLREAVAAGRPCEIEIRNHRRDGSPFWNYLTISPVRGEDGTVAHHIGVLRDVTERRRAEDAVRSREKYFRLLIENAYDLIAVLEGDGEIRYTSRSISRVLGHEPRALEGRALPDLVHPDDHDAVMDAFDRAVRNAGLPVWFEFRIRDADGGWRLLEASGTSLLHDRDMAGIVVNARDVTDRREAELALEESRRQFLQAQKMEAVGRLAGGVAHDFNNLLTAIRGNADLVLLDLADDHPVREDVEEIRRASDRAASLTRQLLAFSRRQVLQPTRHSLNATVREMQKMLRRLIGEDVHLQVALDPGLDTVRVDPGQMEQVVLNLAVNARDAMPGGGELTIETANVELDTAFARRHPFVLPGPYVCLSVRDTGTGMDRETLEQAFEPFFTTKPPGRGTGLGLSTVYGIVKQSEGYVFLESEPGTGTVVSVYLPRAQAPDDEPAGGGDGGGALRKGAGTVLLVEDEVAVRNLAKRVLQRGGYQVLEAHDGYQALRVASAHDGPIDLLLSDVVMPRMGGRELARRLRDARPGVRVLFVSGYAGVEPARDAVPLAGEEVLEKPYSPESLARAVHDALSRPAPGS